MSLVQDIRKLKAERNVLEDKLLKTEAILKGSLIQRLVKCSDPNCRCSSEKKSDLHGPYYYLSKKVRGETKLIYLSNKEELKEMVQNYRIYQKSLTQIRRLNRRLEKLFASLRQQKIKEVK